MQLPSQNSLEGAKQIYSMQKFLQGRSVFEGFGIQLNPIKMREFWKMIRTEIQQFSLNSARNC